jgi:uncharacterized protein (TIGR03437 family)
MYKGILLFAAGLALSCSCFGQSALLTLDSGNAAPGGSVTLHVSLASPAGRPAALEWTIGYPAASIASVAAAAGPAAVAGGKSVACALSAGLYTCLVSGMNQNAMANGVIASLAFVLTPAASTMPISLSNTIGAMADGTSLAVTSSGGTISVAAIAQPTLSTLNCSPASVTGGSSSTCTVGLSLTAPAGGAVVSLSVNNSAVTVPASVTIPAGAVSATFTALTKSAAANQSAVITAGYGGVSLTTSLVVAPVLTVTGLQCNLPSGTLIPSLSSAVCTVTLAGPALASEAVALSSNAAYLTVPTSVTVPAGAASANFTINTGTITNGMGATMTATAGGVSKSLPLFVVITVSSVECSPSALPAVLSPATASTTCTVTLNQAQIFDSPVTLSSNSAALIVPPSIVVPAGKISSTFVATAKAAAPRQATITATRNGYSASFVLSLGTSTLTAPVLSRIQCVPASVLGGSSSACTITLSGAAPGGASVSLSANNSAVTVPGAVTVPAGAASVSLSISTTPVAATRAATITASFSGASQTASLSVLPPAITSQQCAPATVAGGSGSTCTVTLSGSAPAGGLVVSLSSSNSAVTVPASLTIPGGSVSATFIASAGAVASNQAATIMASFSGASQTASIAVVPAIKVTGLKCNNLPAGTALIPSLSSTVCTVTLASSALASEAVALSSNASYLTVPASVTVPSGAASANFTINTGTITNGMGATMTATAGGVSKSLPLFVVITVSSVECSPSALPAVLSPATASTTCTVTLNQAQIFDSPVTLSSNSAALIVPPSIVVPAGKISSTFVATAKAAAPRQATITATRNGYSASFVLSLGTSTLTAAAQISSVSCSSTTLTAGSSTSCSVQLTEPARVPTRISLDADDTRMEIPASVEVLPGNSRANFAVKTRPGHRDSVTTIVATADQSTLSLRIPVTGIRPLSLSCAPKLVPAGGAVTCELRLNSSTVEDPFSLDLDASDASVKLPSSIATRPRQSSLTFQAVTDPAAASQRVSIRATFGANRAQDNITVQAGSVPLLKVPGRLAVRSGSQLSFEVTASSASGLPLQLSSGVLPEGAVFDPDAGRFTWTPSDSQRQDLVFTATDPNQVAASAHAIIDVDLGLPVIDTVVNAATGSNELVCAPGSLASIHGRWLSARAAEDPTGASLALSGTKVLINGEPVPLVSVSPSQVNFVCPAAASESAVEVTVKGELGDSAAFPIQLQDAAPGIFTVDRSGSGQAAIVIGEGALVAGVRSYRYAGEPAQPGDPLWIPVTGLGAGSGPGSLTVILGESSVEVEAVRAPGTAPSARAGVTEVRITVPAMAPFGDAVPLAIQVVLPDGRLVASRPVTIAIEPARQ